VSDAFAGRRREAFQADLMPDWTADAACRDKVTVAGEAWEAAFTDDLTYKRSGEYRWPAGLLEVMAVCATCPVREPCMEYGFTIEEPILLGCRFSDEMEEWLTPEAVGVYGGIPGPMRERFRRLGQKGLAAADEWFASLCIERGWAKAPDEEAACG
jgi:hypothetical protein